MATPTTTAVPKAKAGEDAAISGMREHYYPQLTEYIGERPARNVEDIIVRSTIRGETNWGDEAKRTVLSKIVECSWRLKDAGLITRISRYVVKIHPYSELSAIELLESFSELSRTKDPALVRETLNLVESLDSRVVPCPLKPTDIINPILGIIQAISNRDEEVTLVGKELHKAIYTLQLYVHTTASSQEVHNMARIMQIHAATLRNADAFSELVTMLRNQRNSTFRMSRREDTT